MKKFIRILIILVLIPTIGIILAAIAGSVLSNSDLADENARLKKEITLLKAKIQNLENEPGILYSNAISLKNADKFQESIATLRLLQEKYPDYKKDEVSSSIVAFGMEEAKIKEEETERKRLEDEEREKRRFEQAQLAEVRKREREQVMAEATKNLTKSRDEMREIDWYYDKSTPRTNNTLNIHSYIGKKENNVWLRFKMCYKADDWLFVESIAFKVDGENFLLNYGLFNDWERDNSGGSIWEWKDVDMDRRTWDLVRKIAESDKTMMRYNGRQYYFDREVSAQEKQALKNILFAYEAMGGAPPK